MGSQAANKWRIIWAIIVVVAEASQTVEREKKWCRIKILTSSSGSHSFILSRTASICSKNGRPISILFAWHISLCYKRVYPTHLLIHNNLSRFFDGYKCSTFYCPIYVLYILCCAIEFGWRIWWFDVWAGAHIAHKFTMIMTLYCIVWIWCCVTCVVSIFSSSYFWHDYI